MKFWLIIDKIVIDILVHKTCSSDHGKCIKIWFKIRQHCSDFPSSGIKNEYSFLLFSSFQQIKVYNKRQDLKTTSWEHGFDPLIRSMPFLCILEEDGVANERSDLLENAERIDQSKRDHSPCLMSLTSCAYCKTSGNSDHPGLISGYRNPFYNICGDTPP